MSRTALVVFALIAAVAIVFFVADPLGFRAGPAVDRPEPESGGPEPIDGDGPVLAGKPGAVDPATGDPLWIGGERVGAVDLGLGSASLKGAVTGEGQPLFGARVRLALDAPKSANHAVRTRRDGTWEIHGVPAGAPDVRATHADYVGRTLTIVEFGEDAEVTVETIDLDRRRPNADGIVLKVTDEFGRPVAGAKVLATTMMYGLAMTIGSELSGTSGAIERRTTTGEDGQAEMLGLPAETYDVVATAPGYRIGIQPSVVVAEGRVRHLAFHLKPGVSVSGTIVDAGGAPVGGAYVIGMHQPSFAMAPHTRSAADGSFTLDGLREGSYWLMSFHDEHGEGQANPVKSPSTGTRIQLPGTGTLAVVVKRADGTPVPRYRLRPFRAEAFGYSYSTVFPVENEEGRHEVALPKGAYNVSVQSEEGDFSTEVQAQVQVGETTSVEVTLPTTLKVEGVVVDAEGRHVEGAEIYVKMGGMPGGPRREQYARTDMDGHFEVSGLPAEVVKLHVEQVAYATQVIEIDLSGGESPPEQTVRLSNGGAIEGRLTKGGEEPVVGEQINVYRDWFHPRTTTTDASGRFRVAGLSPGTWSVSTSAFEWGAGGVSKSGIEVPDGGTATVDLDLGAAEGTVGISGVVRRGGEPVAGATISVIDSRGWEFLISTTTDNQGTFGAEGVLPGRVTVQVATGEGVRTTRGVDVPAEGLTEPVTVDLGIGALQGRLVMLDGTPVAAAWIQVEAVGAEGWGRVRAQITSDGEGLFKAAGLEPGTYQVRVTGSGHAGLLTDPFEVPEGGTADLGTYRLATGVTLQGRVVDDAGAPVEDATIALRDDQGRPVYLFSLVTTGSDGRYAVTGLETGRFVVGFEAKGYAPASETIDLGAEGATVDGVLLRGGTVAVTLQDAAGNPVPGARVGLVDAAGRPVERTLSLVSIFQGEVGRSREDGVAIVPDLAPGSYTLTVRSGATIVGDPPVVHVAAGETTRAVLVVK